MKKAKNPNKATQPKHFVTKGSKEQSAMEYLMTYGWAILIIAIVLVALDSLGVFNPQYFASTANPGSCSIYRPNGPGTTTEISLVGTCNSQIPKFVFRSQGVGDYVLIANSSSTSNPLNIANSITITAWVSIVAGPYHDVVDKEGQYGMKIDYNNNPQYCNPSGYSGWCLEWDTSNDWTGYGFPLPNALTNQWMFLAVSQSGNTKYWYDNGALLGTETVSGSLSYAASNVAIGSISPCSIVGYGSAEWFNGDISNVQIYSTALSQNSIEALYQEGIGGAPIDLQNIAGWWPLNGNTNDYSGNGNNGNANGGSFYGGPWWINYAAP